MLTTTKRAFKVKLSLTALENRLVEILQLSLTDNLRVTGTNLVVQGDCIYLDCTTRDGEFEEVNSLDAI